MTSIWSWSVGEPTDPMLLCLHGIGSSGDAFLPQAPLAARCGRRLVAWDAPGYRHSPDPAAMGDGTWTFDDWADAAADLIAATAADGRADVLGVSYGGVTATRLALRHPDRIRSLILADSSVGSGTAPHRADAMRARADIAHEMGFEALAAKRSASLLGPTPPDGLVEQVGAMMVESSRFPGYGFACAAMADTDHSGMLGQIGAPTLVVVGAHDEVTPPHLSEQLAEGIPGAELVVIDGAGHLANQEYPEQFNDAVARFLG